MADNAPKRKYESTVPEIVALEQARAREAARKRAALWHSLARFIHKSGAQVVSLPQTPRMRIEVRQGSSLASKLAELGFNPTHIGVETRLMSGDTPFQTVDIIEVMLGK